MLSFHRSLQLMCAALIAVVCSTALRGCTTHDRAEPVPTTAYEMHTGREPVSFTARPDGMVYVEDANDQKLVYSGQLRRGQKLSLDSTRTDNQIMLAGQTVSAGTLRAAHDLNIY